MIKNMKKISRIALASNEAEVSGCNAIPVDYGDRDCSCYPRGLSSVGRTNNKGVGDVYTMQ